MLACCAFPDALSPAWEELDRVVGRSRSPRFSDEAALPYVRAFVKEVFRWRSVAILGGQPHAPVQDEWYKVGHCPFPISSFPTPLFQWVRLAFGFKPG